MVLISGIISSLLHFAVTSQLFWHRKKYWSELKKILEYAPKVLAFFQMSKHNKISFVYTASVLEIGNPQNLCLIDSEWRKAMTDALVDGFTCTETDSYSLRCCTTLFQEAWSKIQCLDSLFFYCILKLFFFPCI